MIPLCHQALPMQYPISAAEISSGIRTAAMLPIGSSPFSLRTIAHW